MKTNQLILAAALVALAACNKESFDLNGPNTLNDEIGFTAVTKKATKANNAIITGTTYATDDNNSFKVWGWQSEKGDFSEFSANAASNFMSNLTIEWTGGRDSRAEAWRNADNYYYWPFTGKIGFLAIHPSTVTPSTTGWDATNKKAKATFANYTISADNITTDLMFAYAAGSRNASDLDAQGKLGLVFQHALSQIVVNVKTDDDYTADVKFDVNSVEFNKIDLSGDLAYGWVSTETPAFEGFKFNWTNNNAQTQNWMYFATVKENINKTAAQYGNPILMIPQPANMKDATADPVDDSETTLTISYSMQQKPLDDNAKITGTVVVAAPWLTADATPASVAGWEPGKKYVYTLNFKLNEILFAPEVTDWVEVDMQTINILD